MKNLIIVIGIFIFSLMSSINSNAQNFILETSFGGQSYTGANAMRSSGTFKFGYEFKSNYVIDFSVVSSQAKYHIRMPDINVSSPNWGGIIFNVLTVSNSADWSNSETKEVYKSYFRNMYSYNLTFGILISNRFKIFIGPSLRHNSVTTEPSDELTYSGTSFSVLEFEDYFNYGSVIGIDYMYPLNRWSYFLLDGQIQIDHYSTSETIRGSRFMDSSFTFGLGIGLRISNFEKKVETLK